ncbi:MAG: methyl-accepting chemotaxis protein [Neomegalonema sp.]|nr:methyl-accepting chemotaxis protein [Neomegalonema sp.]
MSSIVEEKNTHDWRAAARIYAVFAVPLVGLVFFIAMLLIEAETKRGEAVELMAVVAESTHGSELAHELQRERGFSAGFIGSGGKKFGPQLAKQRRETDKVLARVRDELSPEHARNAAARERATALQSALAKLSDYRGKIDRQDIKVPGLAKYYTGTIMLVIGAADEHLKGASTAEMATLNAIYGYILHAKEFAGRERAAGANGFGAGRFKPKILAWFRSMQDRQAYLFSRIRAVATPEQIARLDAALATPEAARIRELREIGLASPMTGDMKGVTGPGWFAASSAYLGRLLEVERAYADEITAAAVAKRDAASNSLLFYGCVGAGIVAFVLGWGLMMLRGMITAMRGLAGAIGQIELARADVLVPAQDRKDELGVIARALSRISAHGATMARVQAALDASPEPILVTDTAGTRVYGNAALDKLLAARSKEMSSLMRVDPGAGAASRQNYEGLISATRNAAQAGKASSKPNGANAVELTLADVKIDSVLVDISTSDGEPLGYCLQLSDMTIIRGLEVEVLRVIDGVKVGELDTQVTAIDNAGFTSVAANGINAVTDIVRRFMADLGRVVGDMAAGDLTGRMPDCYDGQFGHIARDLNTNLNRFASTLQDVVHVAGDVKSGAAPISDGAKQLSCRAESQAAALQEASATMEEISATVRDTASNASGASTLTAESNRRAALGQEVVQNAVSAMSAIEESSSKISAILAVIDSIAFQTNLLALNAAVEAARAGDAGKGFAVVAAEVRTLAQRSGEAARDIRELIQTSSSNVVDGVRLVNETGEALASIVESIAQVSARVSDIAVACDQQAAGVQEIGASLSDIDQQTQQNAALAEQSVSSSRDLLGYAERLGAFAVEFKLGEGDAPAAKAA